MRNSLTTLIASVMVASTIGTSIASAESGADSWTYAHNYCAKTTHIAFSGVMDKAESVRKTEDKLLDQYNGDIRKINAGEVLTMTFPELNNHCTISRCESGTWKIVDEDGWACSYKPAKMDGFNYVAPSYIATDASGNYTVEVNFGVNCYDIGVSYDQCYSSFSLSNGDLDNTVFEDQYYMLTDSDGDDGNNLYAPLDLAIYSCLIDAMNDVKDYESENSAISEELTTSTEEQSEVLVNEFLNLNTFVEARFNEAFASEATAACAKIDEMLDHEVDFRELSINEMTGRDVALCDCNTVVRVGENAYISFCDAYYDWFGVLQNPSFTLTFEYDSQTYQINVFQEDGEIQFGVANLTTDLLLDGLGRTHVTPQYEGEYYIIHGAGQGFVDTYDLAIIEILASIANDFNS